MRLRDVVASDDLTRFLGRFPGLEPDRITIRPIPAVVAARFPGLAGMALGRTIWVQDAFLAGDVGLSRLLAHEVSHVMQWRRHGPVGFPVRYCTDYLRGRLGGLGHAAAYHAIPAEEEARQAAKAFGAERPE